MKFVKHKISLILIIAFLATLLLPVMGFATEINVNSSQSTEQQADTSQSVEQSARKAIEAFFNAGLQKNLKAMVSNSIDNHLAKSVLRHQLFEQQVNDFLGYQIQSVEKVDSTHATAIVEIREKHQTVTMEYPVVFNGKKWLVDIDHAKDITPLSSSITTSSTDETLIDKNDISPLSGYAYAMWHTTTPSNVTTAAFTGTGAYYIAGASQHHYYVNHPNPHVFYTLKEQRWWGGSVRNKYYFLEITFDLSRGGPATLRGSIR